MLQYIYTQLTRENGMPRAMQLHIEDNEIDVLKMGDSDYISLTQMAKGRGGNTQIQNWIRLKETIAFLGLWENIHNLDFNSVEFHRIKNEAGSQSYLLSVTKWTNSTGALGIVSRAGRYGGTYAHVDIAFEFASWLSPEFKLLLITEFKRLKQQEQELENWDFKRFLSKANYKLHSNTIKDSLIPQLNIAKAKEWLVYADEADILNKIIFGMTAAEWRALNREKTTSGRNQRDYASAKQLLILANLEAINANLISRGMTKEKRVSILYQEARRQASAISSESLDKAIGDKFDIKQLPTGE